MKHIQNDYTRIQLQNALMAQEIAEAAKLRQAEKARAKAAETVEDLHDQTERIKAKKIPGKDENGSGGEKKSPRAFTKFRYRLDGTLEEDQGPEEGSGPSSTRRIDIKA